MLLLLLACFAEKTDPTATADSGRSDGDPADTAPSDTDPADPDTAGPACPAEPHYPQAGAVLAEGLVELSLRPPIAGLRVEAQQGDTIVGATTDEDGAAALSLGAGDWSWGLPGCPSLSLTLSTPVTLDRLQVSAADVSTRAPEADRVIAHIMGWFGSGSGHIDVGYDSTDPAVTDAQVAAAAARGIGGFAIDGYGDLSTHIDTAYAQLLASAAAHNAATGDDFAIGYVYDYGDLRWGAPDPHDSASTTAHMIAALQSVHARHMAAGAPHPEAVLAIEGRPVLLTFPYDDVAAPDLAAVRAALDALDPSPLLVDLHPDSAAAPIVDGFSAWISFEGGDGSPYLNWFYDTALAYYHHPVTIGAAWPGFDDSLASWGGGRVQDGRCGHQLDDTLAIALDKSTAWGARLPLLQLATWNDYEEGSAIEPGVDGCVAVSALTVVHGDTEDQLTWTVSDPEGWVTGQTVYVSDGADGWAPVAHLPAEARAVALPAVGSVAPAYRLVAETAALLRNGLSP